MDPGPTAPDNGAPWRGLTGLERAYLFQVYELARSKKNMSVAFPRTLGTVGTRFAIGPKGRLAIEI